MMITYRIKVHLHNHTFIEQLCHAGTYYYVCGNHPTTMYGQIIVTARDDLTNGLGLKHHVISKPHQELELEIKNLEYKIKDQLLMVLSVPANDDRLRWLTTTGDAGTYYYASSTDSSMGGTIYVHAPGGAGTSFDGTSQ